MTCSLDYLLSNIFRVTSIRKLQITSPSGTEGRFALCPKFMCPFELRPLSVIGINVGCSPIIDIALELLGIKLRILQVREPGRENDHTHHTRIAVNDKVLLLFTKEGLSSVYVHETVAT